MIWGLSIISLGQAIPLLFSLFQFVEYKTKCRKPPFTGSVAHMKEPALILCPQGEISALGEISFCFLVILEAIWQFMCKKWRDGNYIIVLKFIPWQNKWPFGFFKALNSKHEEIVTFMKAYLYYFQYQKDERNDSQ